MSRLTVKELADKLEANPKLFYERMAAVILDQMSTIVGDPASHHDLWVRAFARDRAILDRLFPPEPKAETWTPLIITFRKNQDGQWEGQIISQDERDRAERGTKRVGAFAGVEFVSCAIPEWPYDGKTFCVRGESRSGDLRWFSVGSESNMRKIQAAVRELNKSRGIELAQ